jgi:hypothetical protein
MILGKGIRDERLVFAGFPQLERLKKCCSQFGARIFGYWRGFGEGAGLQNPVTEPKRSQCTKRPPAPTILPNGYNIFENALVPLLLPTHRYKKHCARGIDLALSGRNWAGRREKVATLPQNACSWTTGEGK